jgi:catechol 2,3-dioxygenase-like lactoylglutathione lyase family enzyme
VKKLISTLTMIWILSAGTAWAQAFQPNAAGVTMGHWHLNTTDVEANKKIFVALGGVAMTAGDFEVVRFPGVVVYLHQRTPAPPTGGTVGSVVNHVGFIVQDVQLSVAAWKATGVAVLPGGNDRTDQAWVVTPDELRIEILENKDQRFPIQHHHVHFNVPEASISEIQSWYANVFGATPGTRGRFQAADAPGVNLTFSETDTPTVATRGRALDHIGFDVTDLEAFTKKLEAAGIELDRPYTKNEETGSALAFIHDPWGTNIELNERVDPVYVTP